MTQKTSLSRYERHIDVPEIGIEGQKKLFNASVLIVGMGGLGCPAAQYLVAAGIGHIGLMDADTVSLSNLQRQILYGEQDVGKPKVEIAARRLKEISSACAITQYPFFLTKDNAAEVISKHDITLDCTDNFDSRYLINYICYAQKKPLVSASIYHHDGQLSVYKGYEAGAPCYQCLYPKSGNLSLLPNCREGGIVGPLAGILGTMQAATALNELLGIGDSLSGYLSLFNALNFESQKILISKRPECEICSNSNIMNNPNLKTGLCGIE